MSIDNWNNNQIQFPRLIVEILAIQDNIDFSGLAASMNLSETQVRELFTRAEREWEIVNGGDFNDPGEAAENSIPKDRFLYQPESASERLESLMHQIRSNTLQLTIQTIYESVIRTIEIGPGESFEVVFSDLKRSSVQGIFHVLGHSRIQLNNEEAELITELLLPFGTGYDRH